MRGIDLKSTSMRTRKKNELNLIFNFFIKNNFEIEQRKLELQQRLKERKDKEL